MLDLIFYIIIPLFALLIIFIFWYKHGKDENIGKKLSMYPPKLNSILFGFYYKGSISMNDIKSFIIYLATKGYVKIIEDKKTYKIKLIKKSNEEIENMFLNNLFKGKKEIYNKDINNDLIILMNKYLKTKNDIETVFENESLSKKSFSKLIIFVTYFVIIIKVLIHIRSLKYLIIVILFNLIGLKIMLKLFDNKQIKYNILGFILGILLILIPLRKIIVYLNDTYKILFLISLILISLMIILYVAMPKRTKKSTIIMNKILGFKEYIENINEMDKEYYYQMLPYMFNLNKQGYWLAKNKFKNPLWYKGDNFEKIIHL